MNSLERFYATVNREKTDRPAAWLGMPDIKAQPALFEYYGVKNMHQLKLMVGDDIYAVEVPYHSPVSNHIFAAFDWYMNGKTDAQERTLTADGCFKNAEDPDELKFFQWPDPEQYMNVEECRKSMELIPKDKARIGMMWSSHFQDTCASFGMETALMHMIDNPEIYEAVNSKVLEFYLKANEIFYESTRGELQGVLIGNDMGSQRGLIISPETVRKFVIPGCKKLVEQAHSYGLKVIYHSCGSITEIIPDLIDAGVDVIHPIQALASGMEPEVLKEKFGTKVSFCGGVDTQHLLVKGSPEMVRKEVQRLRDIFETGLILSPSHEAVLPDIPPKNIGALFEETAKIYS